jgi:hypothetical protein
MHTSEFMPEGWYEAAERTLVLSLPWQPGGAGNAPR